MSQLVRTVRGLHVAADRQTFVEYDWRTEQVKNIKLTQFWAVSTSCLILGKVGEY